MENGFDIFLANLFYKQLAIEDYNQAISNNPNYANAYNNRAITHAKSGDKEKAIADFKKASEIYLQQGNIKGYEETQHRIQQIRQR